MKPIVFTDHALDRIKLRKITRAMVTDTITAPDRTEKEADGDTKFIKTVRGRNVQVVSKWLDDEQTWLVKSAWVRGEDDPQPLWLRLVRFPFQFLNRLLRRARRGR